MSFPEQEVIERGAAAWDRLRVVCARKTWEDWRAVGAALLLLRKDAMLEAKTDRPFGRTYTKIYGQSLRENGFHDLGDNERYRLSMCMAHEAEIAAWREGLDDALKRSLNSPSSIWSHFRDEVQPRKTMSKTTRPAPRRQQIFDGVAKLTGKGSGVRPTEMKPREPRKINAAMKGEGDHNNVGSMYMRNVRREA